MMAGKAELRAPECPFCGAEPQEMDPTNFPGHFEHPWLKRGCPLDGVSWLASDWNKRPIERSPAAPAGEVEEAVKWRCFHCDEVFESRECAAHHFGHNEGETPICKIKGAGEYALISALRKAQQQRDEAWNALSAEDTDSARVIYAMRADHAVELRREEEAGYAKGLRDAEAAAATRAAQERRLAVEQAETWNYLWRWVERGLFDGSTSHREALEVMAFHPGAPWNNGEWNVTHKPYAEAFYAKFPKARPIPGEEEKA